MKCSVAGMPERWRINMDAKRQNVSDTKPFVRGFKTHQHLLSCRESFSYRTKSCRSTHKIKPLELNTLDKQGFTCTRHHSQSHCRINIIINKIILPVGLNTNFVLNHSGTHLIFPRRGFERRARFRFIIAQLVASNSAKPLS